MLEGLFLKGRVEEGEIVALYQGIVYLPNTMSLMCDYLFKDNDYLIKSDNVIIDGNPDGKSKVNINYIS